MGIAMMKPVPFLTADARRGNFIAAGIKPGALPNLVRLALSRCALKTMTETSWRELAELMGERAAVWVNRHPRLPSQFAFR